MKPALDERDLTILAERMTALDEREGPRTGDFIRFVDGELRRIAYMWPDGAQTNDSTGQFYLGEHGCSFSGSLHPAVPLDSLSPTDEQRKGNVWIFHHDWFQANNGVYAEAEFRVFTCDRKGPK